MARRRPNALDLLGIDRAAALARLRPPPVDLSQPIAGTRAWRAIAAHAPDPAYRRAVETVRLRYRIIGDPMLLPRTLEETMRRAGLTFREAMIRVALDDGLRP